MKKFHVFFDLDDTLIATQNLYNRVKENVVNELHQFFPKTTKKEILALFEAIDVANVQVYGFSTVRFPTSWRDTFIQLAKQHEVVIKEVEKEYFYALAFTVFTEVAPLYPEALDILQAAKDLGVEVALLTAGDVDVQRKRIQDAEIAHYFDAIHVVPLKTVDTMQTILQQLEPSTCIMVGNSLKSDIYPSLELGMYAIHVKANTWAYDQFQVDTTNNRYFTCALQNVSQVIKEITNKEKVH